MITCTSITVFTLFVNQINAAKLFINFSQSTVINIFFVLQNVKNIFYNSVKAFIFSPLSLENL